ncbi:hypothetical protein [Novosphingobium sp.]|uniref:hypothetical protein n=1 Tax=Novosphingobium sp. TaxID=1874826 RepID=UPI00286E51F6|nr:hypothetical protein [Novosphingobium sp.]
MKPFSPTLRKALAASAITLALSNIWWFSRHEPEEALDYQLHTTGVGLLTDTPEALPLFYERSGKWQIDGKLESSVSSKLLQTNPEAVAGYPNRKYVAVRLRENAGADIFRRALISLLNEGICKAGIYAGKKAIGPGETLQAEIDIYDLAWVRGENGEKRMCQSRFG